LTESKLTIDTQNHRVVAMSAVNHLVDQSVITPDPQAQQLIDQVEALTQAKRQKWIAKFPQAIKRRSNPQQFDSPLGNVIVDAQLELARQAGPADLAFINEGSVRTDLPSVNNSNAVDVTFGDLHAVQPFANAIMRLTLSGQQVLDLLKQQWRKEDPKNLKRLFVSANVHYQIDQSKNVEQAILGVTINGQPLVLDRNYAVIVNSFLAEGGDGFTVLKQATQRKIVGGDIEALEQYVNRKASAIFPIDTQRVNLLPSKSE